MSYTVHRLILSYGLFYCIGLCLVCGVLCTWCGLTERIVMLGLKILLTGKILVNEKGAVVRYDDLICGILLRVGSCLIVELITE